MIRVALPYQLRKLAGVQDEVRLDDGTPGTIGSILDALEARYPALRGTVRDLSTRRRRPFIRFFACEEDFSDQAPDAALPAAILDGTEPFLIVGAMAGG
ncbi:MAG TPA: hypothetical protein VGO59_11085 [Verrucomicrobiae bacterium]|jgi:hypothetical protein